MDLQEDREQLSNAEPSPSINMEEHELVNEVDEKALEGSLGKFKDAESLLKAYNNLQAEFTKKCQSLSKLKSEICAEKEKAPIYTRDDWESKVSDFFEKNEDAKAFSSQIANKLIEDDALAKKDNALELAWAKVASKNYIAPEKLVENDDFLQQYVLNNEKVKNAVLKNVANQIQQAPTVLSSSMKGGMTGLYKPQAAKTLSEAKEIVRKLFN